MALLAVKDIPQVGPLQWGWISWTAGYTTYAHREAPTTLALIRNKTKTKPAQQFVSVARFIRIREGDSIR